MKKFLNTILNTIIISLMLMSIYFAVDIATFSNEVPTLSLEKRVTYSREREHTHSIQGNPENWIIMSIADDYSSAHVLKENGHEYIMTIYEADDDSITINVDGDLHTFYYTK